MRDIFPFQSAKTSNDNILRTDCVGPGASRNGVGKKGAFIMIFGMPWFMFALIVLALAAALFGAKKRSNPITLAATLVLVAAVVVSSVVDWKAPAKTGLDGLPPWDAGKVLATADFLAAKFPGKNVVLLAEQNSLVGERNQLRIQIDELERILKERGLRVLGRAMLGEQQESSDVYAVNEVLAPYAQEADVVVNFAAMPQPTAQSGKGALAIFADAAHPASMFLYFPGGLNKRTLPFLKQGRIAGAILYRIGAEVLDDKSANPVDAFHARCRILTKDNLADYLRENPKAF